MNTRTALKGLVTLLLLSGLALPLTGTAQDPVARTRIEVAALGPQVGEVVPSFNLVDQNGEMQSLDTIRGPNGTMLLFHRSADW